MSKILVGEAIRLTPTFSVTKLFMDETMIAQLGAEKAREAAQRITAERGQALQALQPTLASLRAEEENLSQRRAQLQSELARRSERARDELDRARRLAGQVQPPR